MNEETAVPLDPIYAIGQKTRTVGTRPKVNSAPKWNRWRESLPDHCWKCSMYDKCHPRQRCKWNPNIK